MPLRKTQQGWMWGSKGPFPTKAKALSVARAAYASGYKGEDAKNIFQIFITESGKKVFPSGRA
jgi:hypothetical protein